MMLDPTNRKSNDLAEQQPARKEAQTLLAYLDAFRPVLTDAEIEDLESRINRLQEE